MNIILPDLDTEQATALAQLTAEYNAAATLSLTQPEFGSEVLMGIINQRKVENIKKKGDQLIAGAMTLPDDKRIEFTDRTVAIFAEIASSPNESP
jgi:hypothetical protein